MRNKFVALLVVFVTTNIFFTLYMYFHVKEGKKTSTLSKSGLSIITFATNEAEMFWFQNQFLKQLKKIQKGERPVVHVSTCLNGPPLDTEYFNLHRISSCDVHSLYKSGLRRSNSAWFVLLEPGFLLVSDLVPYLASVPPMDKNSILMVLSMESLLKNGKLVHPTEDFGDLLDKWRTRKLQPFLHHRHFTGFQISHYVLPLLEENSKSTSPRVILELNREVHVPQSFHFLLKNEEKTNLIEILNHLAQAYSHERISTPENIRLRIIEKIKKNKLFVLTEKVILYHHRPVSQGITLAVHLSLDRLESFEKTLSIWNAKFVAVFMVNSKEECKKLPSYPRTMCYLNENSVSHASDPSNQNQRLAPSYPVNTLRNVALSLVETELVFLVDADFVPDHSISQFLNHDIKKLDLDDMDWDGPRSNLKIYDFLTSRHLLVIPAFDVKYNTQIPQNKNGLLELVKSKRAFPILSNSKFSAHHVAHKQVDYDRWYKADRIYEITYKFPFEPYVVGHINQIPMFDERFNYYGDDKVWNHYVMDLMGFKYFVAPNHFLIHSEHPPGPWAQKERNDANNLVKQYSREFQKEMRVLFSNQK